MSAPTDNKIVSWLVNASPKNFNGLLKVMAGNQFNIRATSWYNTHSVSPGEYIDTLSSVLAALIGSVAGISGNKTTAELLQSSNILDPGAEQLLERGEGFDAAKPKAFSNWILFDDQFQYVTSGYDQAGDDREHKTHTIEGLQATNSGYLYVYCSNQIF